MKLRLNSQRQPKILIAGLLGIAIIMSGVVMTFWLNSHNKDLAVENAKQPNLVKPVDSEVKAEPSINFAAMGDMLAHDSVVNQAKTNDGYDFMPYFKNIIPELAKSQVVFCNPETPATSQLRISGYPSFNAPDELPRDLSKTGCNLINLASNHIADRGQIGIDQTIDNWQKLHPLAVTGANKSADDQLKISYFENNNLKVAFLAFADFSNLALPNSFSFNSYHDQALVEKLMTEARQNADVVVVSAHWGVEDSHAVSQDQLSAAKMFADLGADVIIGTGPHVLQKVSLLERAGGGQTLVWYSIGNMLSSQLQLDELTGGIAKFKISKVGDEIRFSDIEFTPTFMSYQWPAEAKAKVQIEKRFDLKLTLLKNAASETALFGTTVDERQASVKAWLGDDVKVKIN